MSKAIERFLEAARILGHPVEVRRFPEGTKTAEDAARAIGCEVGQIVKSLVFLADYRPVLALTSGANRVDLGRLASVGRTPREPGGGPGRDRLLGRRDPALRPSRTRPDVPGS